MATVATQVGARPHQEEWSWLLPVVGMSVLLFAAATAAGLRHGVEAWGVLGFYAFKALRVLPVVAFASLSLLMVRGMFTPQGPLDFALLALRRRFPSRMAIASAALPLALMPIIFAGFGVLKMLMPLYLPFSWDDTFAAADRALFFGVQPWELTHAVLGPLSVEVDIVYRCWVLLLSVSIVGFALFASRYDRARFFLSFSAAWVLLGVTGAYLLSSAGPCYAERIGAASAPEFAGLMAQLRGIYAESAGALNAVYWQDVLWSAHERRHYAFGMGISAMPSLHNAIAVLYALALSRHGRFWATAGWLHAFVIWIGSVHLGWHYAVDGIVAAVAMTAIWWGAGRYLARVGYTGGRWA